MTKTKIILSTVAIGVTSFVAAIAYEGPIVCLCERFPQFDRKIVRKVHREMFWEALVGKYNEIDTDDTELDKIFLEKVKKLTYK